MGRFALAILAVGVLISAATVACDAASGPKLPTAVHHRVTLRVYDSSGARLTAKQFIAIETNDHSGLSNDALLDPATLRVTAIAPLYSVHGAIALAAPKSAALLTFAWPSSDGYSAVFLPLPAAGSYNLNLLLAENAVATLHKELVARPDYSHTTEFRRARTTAQAALVSARRASSDKQIAVAASRAYDAATHAQVLLATSYRVSASTPPRRAVTLDETPTSAMLQRVRDVVGNGGWVRFVLDPGTPFGDYATPLAEAHQLGLRVLAEPVDSFEMTKFTTSSWRARWVDALTALPSVDEWEAGNEVNANWLGSGVPAKVAWAARYVRARSTARVMVTLYWQNGEDTKTDAMFNWVGAHPEVTAAADDVGISLYPENNPLGVGLDTVLNKLHAQVPRATLMLSELGYWNSDLDHTWWWGSKSDPDVAGKAAVAKFYAGAMRGYPFASGGPFWWYYAEESSTSSPVSAALRAGWDS